MISKNRRQLPLLLQLLGICEQRAACHRRRIPYTLLVALRWGVALPMRDEAHSLPILFAEGCWCCVPLGHLVFEKLVRVTFEM